MSPKRSSKENPCPICGNITGHCRTTATELVLCGNFDKHDTPEGWRWIGLSKDSHWAKFIPANEYTEAQRQQWAQKKAERRARAKQESLPLPTLQQRHDAISAKPRTLTAAQNADLLRRGLTQAEIDFCLSQGWLWQEKRGYGIAAVDPPNRLKVGGQKANDDRGKTVRNRNGEEYKIPKYSWLFAGQTHLRQTGQNPLAVWVHPDFDALKPFTINLCEGFLKPLVSALKSWRTDKQIIWIGAAGGIFQDKALERVLKPFPNAEAFILWPDAGAVENTSVFRQYRNLNGCLRNLGHSLQVAWWGQFTKQKADCDELMDERIERIAWAQFAARQNPELWAQTHVPAVKLNQRYLPPAALPNQPGILAVSSPTGTGKTEILEDLLYQFRQRHPDGLADLVGHRNGLLKQTAIRIDAKGRAGVIHKHDMDAGGEGWNKSPSLAYCINSLDERIGALNRAIGDGRKVMIGLDEVSFILEHWLEMMQRQPQTGLSFARLLRRIGEGSGYIVAMQAELAGLPLDMLQAITEKQFPITLIQNDWQGEPWQACMVSAFTKKGEASNNLGRFAATQKILEAVKAGEFPLITTSGQKWLEKNDRILRKQGYKLLRIDSATVAAAKKAMQPDSGGGSAREQHLILQFFINPKAAIEEARKFGYAAIGITPTAESGVSIDDAEFDLIIGYFPAHTSEQAMQLLARDRDNATPRFIFAPDAAANDSSGDSFDPKHILKKWRLNAKQSFTAAVRDRLTAAEQASYEEEPDELINILLEYAAKYQARRAADMAHLNKNIEQRLARGGHHITHQTIEIEESTRELWKDASKEVEAECNQLFADQPEIAPYKAREILRRGSGTREENYQAQKTILLEDYPGLDLGNPETVGRLIFEQRGANLKGYTQAWMIQHPEVAAAIDAECRKAHSTTGIVWAPSIKHEGLKAQSLADIGIMRLIAMESYCENTPEVQQLRAFCIKNKATLRRVLGYQSAFSPEHSGIQMAQWLLRRLGYKQVRAERKGGKGQQIWHWRAIDMHPGDRAMVEEALNLKWPAPEAPEAPNTKNRSDFSIIQAHREIGSISKDLVLKKPPSPPKVGVIWDEDWGEWVDLASNRVVQHAG